ncbi:MAG: serine/threonine protein kinase, partial [Kofleriaceae bacterium]
VKVLDFGVAKVRGATETEVGTIKGKTQYMAPEQLLGEPLDRRADIFALGIVLFELATHQRLFKRASDYLTARAILEEPIARADAVDPAIPVEVADVIAKALARAPSDRYATTVELGDALVAAMSTHGGLAPVSGIAAVVTSTDELSAQRTRQAKVVDAARARSNVSSLATGLLPTRAVHAEKTVVDAAPRERRAARATAILLALTGIAIVAAIAVLVHVMRTPKGAAIHEPNAAVAVTVDAPVAIAAVDAMAEAPAPDAALAVEVEMPPDNARAPRKNGTISIDSTPFATIFIDGKRADVTPLLNHSLSAGRHKIRAVLTDGRAREISVDVPAGRAAKPITLTW